MTAGCFFLSILILIGIIGGIGALGLLRALLEIVHRRGS